MSKYKIHLTFETNLDTYSDPCGWILEAIDGMLTDDEDIIAWNSDWEKLKNG